jgi:adenylosuccinate lyase
MKLKMTIVPLFTRSFAYILLLLSSLIILSTTLQAASILNANTMQMASNIDLTGDDVASSILCLHLRYRSDSDKTTGPTAIAD